MIGQSLSVVVIGRNEGLRLDRCLQSVRRIIWPGVVEVIYVDSASSDGSPERARAFGAQVIVVNPSRPTAALARNAGWRKSTGDLVLFLDGDTIVHPQFATDSVGEFERSNTAVVWGHRRELHPEGSLFNRVLDLDWIYAPGVTEFCGGDALVRRCALEQTGGFDEHLIAGEEPELCARLRARGLQIIHVDRAMTGHDLAIRSASQYWKRATRAGYAYAEIAERFRGSATPLWEKEARQNRTRASLLTAILMTAPALSIISGSWWPLLMAAVMIAALVCRTALKIRWKSADLATCLLYGIHSHFQQIPIFVGQLQYRRDSKAGKRRKLIEYKAAS